jgi:hypothetical protein
VIGAVVGFDICGRRDGWGVRELLSRDGMGRWQTRYLDFKKHMLVTILVTMMGFRQR